MGSQPVGQRPCKRHMVMKIDDELMRKTEIVQISSSFVLILLSIFMNLTPHNTPALLIDQTF